MLQIQAKAPADDASVSFKVAIIFVEYLLAISSNISAVVERAIRDV